MPDAPTTVGLYTTDAPEGLPDAPTTVGLDSTDFTEGLPDAPTTVGFNNGTNSPRVFRSKKVQRGLFKI